MKHVKTYENFDNFYQDLTAEEAIGQAILYYNHAIKVGNTGQADKILANLKSHLEDIGYNWKQDPDALELLGDYLDY